MTEAHETTPLYIDGTLGGVIAHCEVQTPVMQIPQTKWKDAGWPEYRHTGEVIWILIVAQPTSVIDTLTVNGHYRFALPWPYHPMSEFTALVHSIIGTGQRGRELTLLEVDPPTRSTQCTAQ